MRSETGKEFGSAPGLLFRFTSANGKFNDYASQIREFFRQQLPKQFGSVPHNLRNDWLEKKLLIEEVK